MLRATGTEPCDTVADGTHVIDHPDAGDVVWCDDVGGDLPPLELAPGTSNPASRRHHSGLVLHDALDPVTDEVLHAAAEELLAHLARLGLSIRTARRLLAPNATRRTTPS